MRIFLIALILLSACTPKTKTPSPESYFPPADSKAWEKSSTNLKTSDLNDLYSILEKGDSRAFLVLKDGKILIEKYWGKDILNLQNFDETKQWYWASAGKTLTASLIGLAEQNGKLSLSDKTSKYLGLGWTSLTKVQEDKITILHQLTMTTGLNDAIANSAAFEPYNLVYKAPAGERWAYHNAPYTILDKVIEKATGESFDTFFEKNLKNKIGMDGQWRWIDNDHVYFSTAKSMARYGLLVLNKGSWNGDQIINKDYVSKMISTSQDLNKSYGYLWWLNGKASYMLPATQAIISGSVIPSGPADMVCGLGKNGQFMCIVPSKNMVLIRMGNDPDNAPITTLFLDKIWTKLNTML